MKFCNTILLYFFLSFLIMQGTFLKKSPLESSLASKTYEQLTAPTITNCRVILYCFTEAYMMLCNTIQNGMELSLSSPYCFTLALLHLPIICNFSHLYLLEIWKSKVIGLDKQWLLLLPSYKWQRERIWNFN